jgi:hypothetical protein
LPSNEARREIAPWGLFYFSHNRRSSLQMTTKSPPTDLVPIEAVAKELETTVLSVLMHIKRKLLAAQEVDGAWLVSRESLEQFRRDGSSREDLALCRSACASKGGCGSCG